MVRCPGGEPGDVLSHRPDRGEPEKEEDVEDVEDVETESASLPGGRRLDVSWIGAAGAGGLSLPGQEGLARARVGEPVLRRHLLEGHALEDKWTIRPRPQVQPRGPTLSTMPQ